MQEPILFKLSSTGLGYSGCTMRLHRHLIDGYREPLMAARMVYGIAVHKFIDKMFKTKGNMSLAINAAKKAFLLSKLDDSKSMHLSEEGHMIATCVNLWTTFIEEESSFDILEVNGIPLTEQTFGPYLLYESDYIRVVLEGTQDKIGQFRGGCYATGDWKTTSSWDKRKYFSQYELSRQLKIYRLATILESRVAPDSIIGKMGRSNMGTFIDAIFLKPDRNEMTVERSDVFQYSKKEMEEFERDLVMYCSKLSTDIQTSQQLRKQGLINGSCEGKWGKCSFWNVCSAPESVTQQLLDRDFLKVPWNPSDYNSLNEEL